MKRRVSLLTGYPRHRENKENSHKKNPCQRKHREFGNFAKTQGIWFAQVVNSLILKVKDISIMENLRLDRKNTGNLKMQCEWVPCAIYRNLREISLRNAITLIKPDFVINNTSFTVGKFQQQKGPTFVEIDLMSII